MRIGAGTDAYILTAITIPQQSQYNPTVPNSGRVVATVCVRI